MADKQRQMLDVYLQEYKKLKNEQVQRIGFRDSLLYVTLTLFGTVLAFVLGDKLNPYALLISTSLVESGARVSICGE